MDHDHLFAFESDFVESRLQDLPMAVRFSFDRCGIKLTLKQWNHSRPRSGENGSRRPATPRARLQPTPQRLAELVSARSAERRGRAAEPLDASWAQVDASPAQVEAFARSRAYRPRRRSNGDRSAN